MKDNESSKWTIEAEDNRVEARHADGARVNISFNPDGSMDVRTWEMLTMAFITGNEVKISQTR